MGAISQMMGVARPRAEGEVKSYGTVSRSKKDLLGIGFQSTLIVQEFILGMWRCLFPFF